MQPSSPFHQMQLSDRNMRRCAVLCVYKGCSYINSGGEFRGSRTSMCWHTTWEGKGSEGDVISPQSPVGSASWTGHAEKCDWGSQKRDICVDSPSLRYQPLQGSYTRRERTRNIKKVKEAIVLYCLLHCNLGHNLITVGLFWCGIFKIT